MRVGKDTWVIHGFAAGHAVISMACRFVGIADDIMLTLLTMLLVIVICLRKRVGMIFMASAVVLVNLVGFGLGMGFAALFKLVNMSTVVAHPLATFISTEIIGWSAEGCALLHLRRYSPRRTVDSKSLRWLLIAFVLIIVLRLTINIFSSPLHANINFYVEILLDYAFSCMAVFWVAEYAIRSREQAEKAREDADLARFRYLKLKQQVDPHFLFNSLNVLDYMIQEKSTEQASEFTHKLAEVYRYMLMHEDETTVKLRDELALLDDYVSLLKVRFNEGIELHTDIPEQYLSRLVVPCCLQLLMENAVKHNAVSESDPLKVSLKVQDGNLVVSNNLHPKITPTASTGLGLKYLRQQYDDIAHRSITVHHDQQRYTVIIPLL